MFLFTYAAALLAVLYTVTAAAFLLRSRDSLTIAFACYMLTAAGWIGGNVIADVSFTPGVLVPISEIAFAIGMTNVFCFLVLIDLLVDCRLPGKVRLLAYALPNLVVIVLGFTPYAILGIRFPAGHPAEIDPGFPYSLALFVLLAAFLYSGARLTRLLITNSDPIRRKQLLYAFTGLMGTLIGQMLFDLILPLEGQTGLYTLGPISSLFFVLGCGYAVARHKLIDLRLVITLLERKVEERTKEIRALHEGQRQMIFDISHGIQTPLAVLRGKLERFERTMVHDTNVVSLTSSVDSLAHFVQDLLSLADFEQTLQKDKPERFDLSALMRELSAEISIITEASGIKLTANIEPNVTLCGKEKRVREAVMNLAGNAVKYMGASAQRKISIVLSIDAANSIIEVCDTGRGIPESDLPQLFERFYRGKNQSYGDAPGTGLGLAIVKRIVEDHGGSVAVESATGKGSRFTLRFPLRPTTSL